MTFENKTFCIGIPIFTSDERPKQSFVSNMNFVIVLLFVKYVK